MPKESRVRTPRSEWKPKIGPYATHVFYPDRVRWGARLTDDGRAQVEAFLVKYPNIVSLMYRLDFARVTALRNYGVTRDELEAAAFEAVVKSVIRYDPSRPTVSGSPIAVGTVVAWGIRAAIADLFRFYVEHPGARLRSLPSSNEAHDGERPMDVVADPRPGPTDAPDPDETAPLVRAVAKLKGRSRVAVGLYYGLDGGPPLTYAQIAKLLRVTREWVRQILADAVRRLRLILSDSAGLLRECVLNLVHTRPYTTTELARLSGATTDDVHITVKELVEAKRVRQSRDKMCRCVWVPVDSTRHPARKQTA